MTLLLLSRNAEAQLAVAIRRWASGAHSQLVLSLLITYYWALCYSIESREQDELSGLHYAAYVVPIGLFALGWVGVKIANGLRLNWSVLLFVAFIAVSSAVAVMRNDLPTMLAAGLAFGVAAAIVDLKVAVPRGLLNVLFLCSMPLATIAYAVGQSDFGILPWMSVDPVQEALGWRVSLFPGVAESAMFSLLVFLINQAAPRSMTRSVMMALAFYFLVFSGLRTALLAFVLVQIYVFFFSKRSVTLRRAFFFAVVLAFPLALAGLQGLQRLPGFSNELVNQYIFRSAEGLSADELQESIARVWIWTQHMNLAMENPWLGAGTYEFEAIVDDLEVLDRLPTSGSESWLTGWLARSGAVFGIVLAALVWLALRATRAYGWLPLAALLCFATVSLSYGTLLGPYNLIGILLLTAISEWKCPRPAVMPAVTGRINHGDGM